MSAPNIVKLFPTLRHVGRLPTEDELRACWAGIRRERILAAVDACEWAYTHRQGRHHSDGSRRHLLHPANVGRYGCSVLGFRLGQSPKQRFVLTSGANFKLRPGEGELIQFHPQHEYKLCSEPEAVISAISYPTKCWGIYGLTLFSDNMQEEDVSGKFCNIQHPCADCRQFLSGFLLPEAPVTLVRHQLPCDLDPGREVEYDRSGLPLIVEEWTFGDICAHHGPVAARRKLRRWAHRTPFRRRT